MSAFTPIKVDSVRMFTAPQTHETVSFGTAQEHLNRIKIPWGGHVVVDTLYKVKYRIHTLYFGVRFPAGIPMWLIHPHPSINSGKLCRLWTGSLRMFFELGTDAHDTTMDFCIYAGTKNAKIKRSGIFPVGMLHTSREPGITRDFYVPSTIHTEMAETRKNYGYQAAVDTLLSLLMYAPDRDTSLDFAAPGAERFNPFYTYTPINDTGDFQICAPSN